MTTGVDSSANSTNLNTGAIKMSNINPHGHQGIFSNDSFMSNRYEEEKVSPVDYKPPPSAPAGMNNKRGRVKMFTSL